MLGCQVQSGTFLGTPCIVQYIECDTASIFSDIYLGQQTPFYRSAGIRLVGSSKPHEGRVEIFSQGTWGTICDDKFDMIDANVICKELGYARANTKKVRVTRKANPSMKIHINILECEPGDYFWHCSHFDFNRPICGHNEDIAFLAAMVKY